MWIHLLVSAFLLTRTRSSYAPEHVMVDITNEFGACVLKLVASRTENVAFSPYGLVSVALVLYEGTNGPTAAEIHNSLRLPWDRQVTRIGFRDLHRYLKSYFTNDGFLRGLVLSKPNVALNRNYTDQLLFYGFDLTSEKPTKPPPPIGTTSAPFTLAPTTMGSTKPTTLITVPETTIRITTQKKPEETTMQPPTTREAKETTKTEVLTTMTTDKEVESKTTDEEIPGAEVPGETTKISPPPPTEGTTPPMTTEAKVTEAQTESQSHVSESKPSETTSTTQKEQKTTFSVTSTVKTNMETTSSMPPEPTTETIPQTEPPITSAAQTTTEAATSSEPATTAPSVPTTTPPTVPVSSPPTSSEPTTTRAETTTTTPEITMTTTNPEPTTIMTTQAPITAPADSTSQTNAPPVSSETTSETSPETTTAPPSGVDTSPTTSEPAQVAEATTQGQPAVETDNVASESEMVTRKERALYRRGYDGEHREGIPNWVPHYQDPRWNQQAPLETWFFTPAGGERVPVITYTAYLPYAYLPEIEALALQLPLDDPRYFMVILLPEEREGLGKLLYSLQWCPLRGIVNQLKTTAVYATIPAFTIVKHINLVPALAKLGIVRVFDPLRADLSPMSPEAGLYVRTIEQVVTVSLRKYFANHRWFDATPGDVEQHFIANHPFVYMVLDRETQVTLMSGTIVNPVAHNQ